MGDAHVLRDGSECTRQPSRGQVEKGKEEKKKEAFRLTGFGWLCSIASYYYHVVIESAYYIFH